jgi:hypothetical protein
MTQRPAVCIASVLVGAWLLTSAFVLPNTEREMRNTVPFGVLCVAFALTARTTPSARCLSSLLAAWLVLSMWLLWASSPATLWNNTIVALVMFALSLVPCSPTRRLQRRVGVRVRDSRRTEPADTELERHR